MGGNLLLDVCNWHIGRIGSYLMKMEMDDLKHTKVASPSSLNTLKKRVLCQWYDKKYVTLQHYYKYIYKKLQ